MSILDIQPDEEVLTVLEEIASRSGEAHKVSGHWRHRRKDGSIIDVEVTTNSILFADRPARVVLAHDITDRRRAEERMEYQATHDMLTNLPNRILLNRRMEDCLNDARKGNHEPFSLMIIDLDRFKEINDTFGHHYGDMVLKELNPRLRRALRESDTVARLGGDEFGILLPRTDQEGAMAIARRILESLCEPIVINGNRLEVGDEHRHRPLSRARRGPDHALAACRRGHVRIKTSPHWF